MMRLSVALSLVLLAAVAACHRTAATGTSSAPAVARDVDQAEYEILDRVDALGRMAHQSAGSCDRLAAGLDAWHLSNQDELPTLVAEARAGSNLSPAELAKIAERLEDLLVMLVSAARHCEADADAAAAWSRVDALIES